MDEPPSPRVRPVFGTGHGPAGYARPAWVAAAAVSMVAAGLIHLAIAPLHWGHASAHGLFFAVSGLAEAAWGIAFLRRPTAGAWRTGTIIAGGMITLWAITRGLPAPFGDEPGEIEITGVASILLEGLGLAALMAVATLGAESRSLRHSPSRTVVNAVLMSLVAGGLTYLLGMAAVPVFPGLAEPAEPAAAASAGEAIDGNPLGMNTGSLDDLQLVVGGIASPFANGGEVPVAGEVTARLSFTPGDDRYGRELDVYLYRQATSTPLDDATLQATASMRYMEHGTFRQMALPVGEGHFLLLLQFPMPGEWQLELDIAAAGAQNTLYLDLNLFD